MTFSLERLLCICFVISKVTVIIAIEGQCQNAEEDDYVTVKYVF